MCSTHIYEMRKKIVQYQYYTMISFFKHAVNTKVQI